MSCMMPQSWEGSAVGVEDAISQVGLPEKVRPQEISLDDYVRLFNIMMPMQEEGEEDIPVEQKSNDWFRLRKHECMY